MGSVFPEGRMLPPCPDGPIHKIENSWRNVCLSSNAILLLFAVRSVEAREAFLVACIEAPHYENPWESPNMLEKFETWTWQDATPPMFFSGPFLNLLQKYPDKGIEIICTLANFVTDRWEEWDQSWHRRQNTPDGTILRTVKIKIEDQVIELKGDLRVYGWYRDRFRSAPIIVAALMALEKWLYDLLDTGTDVEDWVKQIIDRTKSVAIRIQSTRSPATQG